MPVAPYVRLFHDYADKSQILEEVRRAFLDGIEAFAGRDCRMYCDQAGLAQMHLRYPAEHVNLLEAFVNHRLKRRMLEWSARIGRRDVGLEREFLVEDLLVVRVHYPHGHIGQPSGPAQRPRLGHRIRYGWLSAWDRLRDAYDSRSSIRLSKRFWEYARQRRKRAALPLPYRCHAPHLDSWLGQPMTSLSVWLAIAGVDRDNSMCLYPETFGARLPLNGSQFLGSGLCLPRPTRPDIRDGDLFVFSTDILHSSQLNVSDNTRIALTTRIDSGTPTFSNDSLWFVQRWYSADGILNRSWKRTIVRASEHAVAREGDGCELAVSRSISVPRPFAGDTEYEIGPSDLIPENGKLAVQFENQRILLVRSGGTISAVSGHCPHEGYRLDEGHFERGVIACPGHGLEFDARSGASALPRYRLATYAVRERSGSIFLRNLSTE
jgi:nitrite reductase/ring-hydroxylating ferredoxin subunit